MKKQEVSEKRFWLCYLYPMRMITKEGETITFSLDEINQCTYDHGLLCRIVGNVCNTFDNKAIEYTVCGDGALLINNDSMKLTANELLLHFNDLLCKLLFGGIYVESIDNKDVTIGFLHNDSMIWPVNFGRSLSSNTHARIRMHLANNMETIFLDSACKESKTIVELNTALCKGGELLKQMSNLSTFYLLTGITELRYGNWSSALSNLWIVAEQLIDHLWENRFLNDDTKNPNIPSRIQTLRQDNRTYSASVKQEILYQLGIITVDIYKALYAIRKARNKLVHEGKLVDKVTAADLYKSVKALLQIVLGNEDIPLLIDIDKTENPMVW